MQTHNLKRRTANKTSIKVARGGKRGKTAGRGTKGQKARAGRKLRPEMRDTIKKIPKLRGRGKNSNISFYTKPTIVKLEKIETILKGTVVNPTTLKEAGLIRSYKGVMPKVKILLSGMVNGEESAVITKKFSVSDCLVSETAKAAIEKAGGSIQLVEVKPKTQTVKEVKGPSGAKVKKEEETKKGEEK